MQRSSDLITDFKPGQILYIEHQGVRLYAEVIQTISDRKQCWVRPLALVKLSIDSASQQYSDFEQEPLSFTKLESTVLYDLRQGSDIVCPQSLFHVALDTEVLPILTELNRLKPSPEASGLGENSSAHERIREFIRWVWQTNPELFSPNLNPKLFN